MIVEDNAADVFLEREVIEATGLPVHIDVVQDGEQAIRYFDELDRNSALPCPELVILDINLPRVGGSDVLTHMRASQRCSAVPVLTVSTSDSVQDRHAMEQLGAHGYFKKPSEYAEFLKLGKLVQFILKG